VGEILNLFRKLADRRGPATGTPGTSLTTHQANADRRSRQAIDAILLEYDVQTRDRRLYAQSMFGTIGFVVAGGVALLAAADQARQPLTLLLIPPLLLAGGVLIVVLRIHLLRVSVFLTVVEDDLRRRLDEATYPIVWETTMTGRTGAVISVSSPGRSSAGLSLTIMLLMGLAVSGVLVWPATLLYWQAAGRAGVDLIGSVSSLLAVPRWPVEWAYPALNVLLVAYIVYSWVQLPNALETSRVHFRRTRSRITDGSDEVFLDGLPCRGDDDADRECWRARWEGLRDGELVVIEEVEGISDRVQALRWGRQRAQRVYSRVDRAASYERVGLLLHRVGRPSQCQVQGHPDATRSGH
jgi:hypothetical protein